MRAFFVGTRRVCRLTTISVTLHVVGSALNGASFASAEPEQAGTSKYAGISSRSWRLESPATTTLVAHDIQIICARLVRQQVAQYIFYLQAVVRWLDNYDDMQCKFS